MEESKSPEPPTEESPNEEPKPEEPPKEDPPKKNKEDFFKDHEEPKILPLDIKDCCKIDISQNGSKILVGGSQGIYLLKQDQESISVDKHYKNISPQFLKITPNEFLVTHNTTTQKLECYKMENLDIPLKEFKGYLGISNECNPMINSRFTGDDQYVAWNRGKQCLTILYLKKTQVIDVQNFWLKNNMKVDPMLAILDKTLTRLIGIGLDVEQKDTIIYWKKKQVKDEKTENTKTENTKTVNSLSVFENPQLFEEY
jgi:hypothetical protein